jgi:DNA-binding response OmpR family regulator
MGMPRLLVIDDDAALLDVLAMTLEDAGHEVVTAADGIAGHRLQRSKPFDLLVSDVNLPGVDGFTLCRRLREAGDAVPIVLLTARDTEIDEALGLELGADDYVTKPFSPRVLLARITALLRREEHRRQGAAAPATEVGGLRLDAERLEARWNGVLFTTTVTEFRLLQALARRPGVVFNRQRLLELARDDDSVVVDRLIDTYVRRLRRRIEAIDPSFDRIETVIGAGYKWRDR